MRKNNVPKFKKNTKVTAEKKTQAKKLRTKELKNLKGGSFRWSVRPKPK